MSDYYSQNLLILTGRVGGDPDVKDLQGGGCVASFSLATGTRYKKANGDMVDDTEWTPCVAFGKLAEMISNSKIGKGTVVSVVGKKKTEKYQDKNGIDKSITKCVINTLTFMPGSKGDNNDTGSSAKDYRAATEGSSAGMGDMDDDIPF